MDCAGPWVRRLRRLRESKYFLLGSTFYVGCVGQIFFCVGQIFLHESRIFCVGLCAGHDFLRGSQFFAWSKKILIGFHDIAFQYISCSLNPISGYVKSHHISCSSTFMWILTLIFRILFSSTLCLSTKTTRKGKLK